MKTSLSASSAQATGLPSKPIGASGFFASLARYYSAFLDTDFKKDRLPKRRIETRDSKGRAVGVPLKKYPGLEQAIWKALTEPINSGVEVKVPRGKYLAIIPQTIQDVIRKQVETIDIENLGEYLEAIVAMLLAQAKGDSPDPEIFREEFLEGTRTAVVRVVVSPLLMRMESFFERTENKPLENMLEFEDEICSLLLSGVEDNCGQPVSALLVEHDKGPLQELFDEQFKAELVKSKLKIFFEKFASGDLYADLSELALTQKVVENIELYLYVGTINFQQHSYPLFYLPLILEEGGNTYCLKSEPHLYVNKKAVDYVTQQVGLLDGRTIPSVIQDRIHFLDAPDVPSQIIQILLDKVANACSLRAEIDFATARGQVARSSSVALTNRMSLAMFDKSDESLINDYEAILTGLETGGEVIETFEDMVRSFMLSNPVDVTLDIDRQWDETAFDDRLVFDSPLPLVEEQRKILSALVNPDVHFICVEGPPGTGKSHSCAAIAFNTILSGKSLLFLSDKKEALDVVEDKLNTVLAQVRMGDDFQNPILRLGKAGSNYNQVLKSASVEKIKTQLKVANSQERRLNEEHEHEKISLKENLKNTAEIYSSLSPEVMLGLLQLEEKVICSSPELEDHEARSLLDKFIQLRTQLKEHGDGLRQLLLAAGKDLSGLRKIADLSTSIPDGEIDLASLEMFHTFCEEQISILANLADEIEAARKPLIGYLFSGPRLFKISQCLRDEFNAEVYHPEKILGQIRSAIRSLKLLRNRLEAAGHSSEEFRLAFQIARLKMVETCRDLKDELTSLEAASSALGAPHFPLSQVVADPFAAIYDAHHPDAKILDQYTEVYKGLKEIETRHQSVPEFDYLEAKTKIESLNAQKLAKVIDNRVVDFFYNHKADVKTLSKIIRNKSKFPTEKFASLREAFPCIIAGLRDFAEFIPLEHRIFDVVVIDEASQVSIAQALPALLRAKKVVVFGDRRQFSNVKTSHASREINSAYMRELMEEFKKHHGQDLSALERAKIFDIRSSLMDFFEMTANFSIQLRKHFRSYPEMISFSSEHFYSGNLQPMKIRGKAIADVLEFQPVEHDGLFDPTRNTNDLEAEHIIEQLHELLDNDNPPSVGIITPHTEQQTLISRMVHKDSRAKELFSNLKLKIMTFDTCQGEERDIIYYSLVATKEKDRLSHVFPSSLEGDDDIIDQNLRMQRLNVGFSRGKEKLVFVHSKPITEYRSALSQVLSHYKRVLDHAVAMPTIDEVDPNSPAEADLLHILTQCPVLKRFGENLEVLAQFELGKYLKALDPTYNHPEYRVDFLIRVTDGQKEHHLIVEYDGFEYHFDNTEKVHAGNWEYHLSEADIEREKVLESFGYKMIRVNRFNLGEDPVETLNERISKMLKNLLNGSKGHELVEKIAADSQTFHEGIKNGTHKLCKKCDQIKPKSAFADSNTSSGYGRHCMECKKKTKSSGYRGYRHRRWRYY